MNIKQTLLESITLNDHLTLQNRLVMTSTAQYLARENGCVSPAMVSHYQNYKNIGLVVCEATGVNSESIHAGIPGIYNDEQIESWRPVVKVLHETGSKVFCQLWHPGSRSHNEANLARSYPKGPVATPWPGLIQTKTGKQPHGQPKALTERQIHHLTNEFVAAAKNAIAAGFDGVQLSAAYEYLFAQFLNGVYNQRTDNYGGSEENQCRFLLETVDALIKAIGADRISVKITPWFMNFKYYDPKFLIVYTYLLDQLNERKLATVEIVRPLSSKESSHTVFKNLKLICTNYHQNLTIAGKLTLKEAAKLIKHHITTLVGFARMFYHFPDLVNQINSESNLYLAHLRFHQENHLEES